MRVLFLVDQLASDPRSPGERHPGGAELTDQAAARACPWPLAMRRHAEVAADELARADIIVVGNGENAPDPLLAAIARTGRHVLFEHDLRVCAWRGDFPNCADPVHRLTQRCVCPHRRWRPLMDRARGTIFLTERQRRAYHANPYYQPGRELVLGGSLFSGEELDEMVRLGRQAARRPAAGVLHAPGAFKGTEAAIAHCRANGWPVEEIRDLPHHAALRLMAGQRRLVYLPVGVEAAGRMPIEARLLGCEAVINGQLGIAEEPVWRSDAAAALSLLGDGPARFWRLVAALLDGEPGAPPPPRPTANEIAGELAARRRPVGGAWYSERVARSLEQREVAPPWTVVA